MLLSARATSRPSSWSSVASTRMARSAPVASAARSVVSASLGPNVTTTTSPRRCFGRLAVFGQAQRRLERRTRRTGSASTRGRWCRRRLPPAAILTLLALSGSATRLSGTRIFTVAPLLRAYQDGRRSDCAVRPEPDGSVQAGWRVAQASVGRHGAAAPAGAMGAEACARDELVAKSAGSCRSPPIFWCSAAASPGCPSRCAPQRHGEVVIVTKRAARRRRDQLRAGRRRRGARRPTTRSRSTSTTR